MNQRKKQPERTKQLILEAAGREFALNGYAGSGLGGIVEAAGLTKGALFHHFKDKRALALGWLEGVVAGELEAAWCTPLEAIGGLDGLKAFCRSRCLELRADDAASALVAFAAETASADEVLGAAAEGLLEAWRGALAQVLERGKEEGWIHRSIQPAVEAAFVVATFAGLTVMFKAQPGETIRRDAARALEGYLETLRAA